MAVSYAGIASAGARAGTSGGMDPAAAAAWYDLYGAIFGLAVLSVEGATTELQDGQTVTVDNRAVTIAIEEERP